MVKKEKNPRYVKNGLKLKKLRLAKNLTIEELSKLTGIGVRSLNSYEIGDRNPNDKKKIILAKFYRMPIEELFYQ